MHGAEEINVYTLHLIIILVFLEIKIIKINTNYYVIILRMI
jgi:hypothetical protein